MPGDQQKRRLASEVDNSNRQPKRSSATRESVISIVAPSAGTQQEETADGFRDNAVEQPSESSSLPKSESEQAETTITYIALLRGVNVGGHNRLPMADFRILLSELGYADVRTHLQSGNAVFTTSATSSEKIGSDISEKIRSSLGLTVSVIVRTKHELEEIVLQNPFEEDGKKDGSKLLVLFLPQRMVEAQWDLANGSYLPERVSFRECEVYLWCPNGVGAAKHGMTFWEKRLGMAGTARNWNTVTKLLELAGR